MRDRGEPKGDWVYSHPGFGTCREPCRLHGRCHCGCGQVTQPDRSNHARFGYRKGQPHVFRPGHRARLFPQGAGAWTSAGVDVERIRPLVDWLRAKHGSVRAVAVMLGIPVSTLRGYLYKREIKRVPAPVAKRIVSLVLAHRERPKGPISSLWELDELSRWRARGPSRFGGV